MKLGFNEATALHCVNSSLMADLTECEKNGFDYIELRSDCIHVPCPVCGICFVA